MCFSAGASFTSGVLLTFVGTETLRKIHKPAQIGLASFSLFFAFQQFTEGTLWLIIGKSGFEGLQTVCTYMFMVMAQVTWPLLVPISVLLLEENRTRKKTLFALLTVAAGVALYYTYRLVFYGMHAEVSRRHIVYQSTAPEYSESITMLFYLVATIVPLFVSSIRRIYIVGLVMGLSFIVTALCYKKFLISVWCFFGAVLSFVVFYIIRESHKKFHSDRTAKIR